MSYSMCAQLRGESQSVAKRERRALSAVALASWIDFWVDSWIPFLVWIDESARPVQYQYDVHRTLLTGTDILKLQALFGTRNPLIKCRGLGPYHPLGDAAQENFEASFIASASLPILAIHRSISSWFSRCSLPDRSSAMLSCRFRVASSFWKSYEVIGSARETAACWMNECHASSNLAFPFNSSSLSFTRICKCVTSLSRVWIRRPSCVLLLRSFSNSVLTSVSRACNSERARWASERSARIAARTSGTAGPADVFPAAAIAVCLSPAPVRFWAP